MSHKRSRKKRTLPRQQQPHSESTSLQHELEEFLEQEVEFRRTHDHGEEGADERLHNFIEHLEEEVIHAQSGGHQSGGAQHNHIQAPHKHAPQHHSPVAGALPLHADARVVNGDKYLIGAALLVALILAGGLYLDRPQELELPAVVQAPQPVQPGFAVKAEAEVSMPELPLDQMMVKPELVAEEAAVMADGAVVRQGEQKQNEPAQTVVTTKKSERSMVRVTANLANVRTEPHTDAKVLYRLEKGTEVRKIAVIGGWYRVRLWNGAEAWAHESVFE